MSYSTEFSDYKSNYDVLIDKYVVFEHGLSYHQKRNKSIRKIVKVNKTSFKIKEVNTLFDFSGHAKGLNGRAEMAVVSFCQLLTPVQATELGFEWKRQREFKKQRKAIAEWLVNASVEQVSQIYNLIK